MKFRIEHEQDGSCGVYIGDLEISSITEAFHIVCNANDKTKDRPYVVLRLVPHEIEVDIQDAFIRVMQEEKEKGAFIPKQEAD